jgi:hypothetical protein
LPGLLLRMPRTPLVVLGGVLFFLVAIRPTITAAATKSQGNAFFIF